MATNWQGILPPLYPQGYGRLIRLSGSDDSGAISNREIGHATWKEDAMREADPDYQRLKHEEWVDVQKQRILEEQQAQIRKQEEAKQAARREREALMREVFDSKYVDDSLRKDTDIAQSLAERHQKAALEALKRGNVGLANEFFDASAKYQQTADMHATRVENVAAKKKDEAREALSSAMAGGGDKVSWEYVKPQLAKAGIEIPPQFQAWSEGTKRWAEDQVRMSAAGRAEDTLALREQAATAKAEAEKKKLEIDQLKMNEKARKEALDRDMPFLSRAPKTKEEIGALSGNTSYAQLEDEDRRRVVRDLPAIRMWYRTAGGAETAADAMAMADKDVLSRISNGRYSPWTGGNAQTPAQAGGVPDMATWLTAAKKSNPNASEEDLKKYYTNKYGK